MFDIFNSILTKKALLLLLVFTGSIVYAQENIAPKAQKLTTSYVSTWETLSAINDGYEPSNSADKGSAAYGNWNGAAAYDKWNWVAYQFDKCYYISSSEVYWWADGAGINIPYNTYLEYWDVFARQWKAVPNAIGNGVLANQYNVTSFSPVVTNQVRLHFISTLAQGILEWKVFGIVAQSFPMNALAEINPQPEKGKTSVVTLKAIDANNKPMSAYQFLFDLEIINEIETENEKYKIVDATYSQSALGVMLEPTNSEGLVSFEMVLPSKIDPNDGIRLTVKTDNNYTQLASFQFFEPGLVPPNVLADQTNNDVDHELVLSFIDVPEWRTAITSILVDEQVLNLDDYRVNNGKITLLPAKGNSVLTLAGKKNVEIRATGYNNVVIAQQINHGAINAAKSFVDSTIHVYRPSTTQLTVYARDAFMNPVSGYSFSYNCQTINNDESTNEVYVVDGKMVYANSGGNINNVLGQTNDEGKAILNLKVPFEVNLNDGIEIGFKLSDFVTPIGQSIGYLRKADEKEAYKPNELKTQSDFSWDQTYQSANFVAFWGGKTGSDPAHPSNGGVSFNPQALLNDLESYYSLYIDSMHFITNPSEGSMAKYKFVVILFDTWNTGYQGTGTAYGGSVDSKIGAMWMSPSAGGFVTAHEFGHSCQAMVPIQYPGKGFKNKDDNHVVGMYWEACANYMAYLSTGQLGNAISPLFVNTAMMQYLSTIDYRQYESIYFPAYIIDKHTTLGLGQQWRAADVGDNPFDAYQKGFGLSRDEMRREAGLFAMHNVTWDYSFGSTLRSYLANLDQSQVCREFTFLESIEGKPGKYIVPREMAPADYGYNIIPVFPDSGAVSISASLTGFENIAGGGGGWSYGFVAVDDKGNPRYSKVALETDQDISLAIQASDKKFYMVVMATPLRTNTYVWTPAWPQIYRFPYVLTFKNALPAGHQPGYNSQQNLVNGTKHVNGGGFVAATANVSASAYVGPNAQILGNARVRGNARIEDFAIVTDNAVISDSAMVRGNAIVGKSANIHGAALIEKAARVYNGDITDNAVVTGSAVTNNCRLSADAIVKDVAWLSNVTLRGRAIVGGDKNAFTTCAEGIYLQLSRETCDQKLWVASNDDINQSVDDYIYPNGDIPEAPGDLQAVLYRGASVILTWDEALDNEKVNSYLVFINGQPDHYAYGTTDTLFNLKENTSYIFTLRSRDNVGNISAQSTEAKISTKVSVNNFIAGNDELLIYPNPANNTFTVEMDGFNSKGYVEITNLLGQTVFTSPFPGSIVVESKSLGNKGIYLVKVECDGRFVTQKVVIENE